MLTADEVRDLIAGRELAPLKKRPPPHPVGEGNREHGKAGPAGFPVPDAG